MSRDKAKEWQPNPDVVRWATKHGFGESIPLNESNLRILARQYGSQPVGLYLWETATHNVYIGISNKSVVGRLRQHVRDRPEENIMHFRYRQSDLPRLELRDLERNLVHDAISAGLVALNREYAATIVGDSTLDDLLPVDAQKLWLDDPVVANKNDRSKRVPADPRQVEASAGRFNKFMELPDAPKIIEGLGMYLVACVPFPKRTIHSHWGCSCLPGTKLASGRRLVTLNMRVLEMLWFSSFDGATEVGIGTDYRFLPARNTRLKLLRYGAHFGGTHLSGGPYEQVLHFNSIESFLKGFRRSEDIRRAAASFALDRMRMGKLSGRYLEAHNVLLADKALGAMDPTSFTSSNGRKFWQR